MCRELGWLVNFEKSELEPKQTFDFVGYQFDLRTGRVRPTPDRWQSLKDKILEILSLPACPVWQFMSLIGLLLATEKQVHLGRLHMRPIQWHLKKQLEDTGISGEDNPYPHIPTSSSTVVAERKQCPHRPAPTSRKACYSDLYRCIKRRVGRSLKRAHCKRNLVLTRKQAAHKLPRIKSSISSPKTVPRPLHRPDSLGGNRQHHSSVVYKQGGRHEVGPIMCPTVENLDLVYQEASDSQSPTHTGPVKC